MSKEIYFLKKCRQNVGKRDRVGGKKSGAQEGTRTPTLLLEADFKSAASTIPPPGHLLQIHEATADMSVGEV